METELKDLGLNKKYVVKLPELDDGQTISNKTKKINTKNESKLLKKHKSLEHQFVYKQLINYLRNNLALYPRMEKIFL